MSGKGFTLVELLIVISIISVLVSIVLIAVNPIRVMQNTRDSKRRSEIEQIRSSLQMYFNENNRYPTAGEVTGGGPISFTPTYMRQLPNEWAARYRYSQAVTDYDASVTLENPNVVGNDSRTMTKCSPIIAGAGGGDYFICPD